VIGRLTAHFGDGRRALDPKALVSFIKADTDRWSVGADDDRAVIALKLA
jgi:hypothetical protein